MAPPKFPLLGLQTHTFHGRGLIFLRRESTLVDCPYCSYLGQERLRHSPRQLPSPPLCAREGYVSTFLDSLGGARFDYFETSRRFHAAPSLPSSFSYVLFFFSPVPPRNDGSISSLRLSSDRFFFMIGSFPSWYIFSSELENH